MKTINYKNHTITRTNTTTTVYKKLFGSSYCSQITEYIHNISGPIVNASMWGAPTSFAAAKRMITDAIEQEVQS